MKNPILVGFGNKVREKRLSQNLSQEELAFRTGLHRTYIGMIERAEKNLTLINIEKIAIGLGVSAVELLDSRSSVTPPTEKWVREIQHYCDSLNISTEDLHRIVTDLKVSPMIRGKAFEFSVFTRLKRLLPEEIWEVRKPSINAQTGAHDIDVLVIHRETKKEITVECKLAKKGGFKIVNRAQPNTKSGDYCIEVKCMRSRTTQSDSKVEAMAKLLGVSKESFKIHSDQYRISNFHVVASSIGNAFYETVEDEQGNLIYQFQPTEKGREFIQRLQPIEDSEDFLQAFVFNKVYMASSIDLAVSSVSGVRCSRKECTNKENCGFIPNYPTINFGNISLQQGIPSPINGWYEIEQGDFFFRSLLKRI
jgi:transcriptional regulator with XRE-family HTH domain